MTGLPYNANVEKAAREIVNKGCDQKTELFVIELMDLGRLNKFISEKQARKLGHYYKEVVNGGEYVHWDWWNNNELVVFYTNKDNWPTNVSQSREMAVRAVDSWKHQKTAPEAKRKLKQMNSVATLQMFTINAFFSGDGMGVI